MFSGKTEEVLRRLRRADIAKQGVCLVRPMNDTRTLTVQAHSGGPGRLPDIVAVMADLGLAFDHISSNDSMPADHPTVVVLDESQFFEADTLVEFCRKLVRRGNRVIVAGLDLDWHGEPFMGIARLAAEADEVVKLAAVCVRCGVPATRSHKIVAGTDRVDVGGSDKYEAHCLGCFLEATT